MSLEKLVKLPKMLVPGSSLYDAYTAWRRGEQTHFGEALEKDGTRAVLYTVAGLLAYSHLPDLLR
ncbi:hypothetical protein C4580_00140 [Candidatus Woesearchaeota archaeon]|nr:MAG: hypothetical protein C4580_00140 [Candidatus Woesearchaeota archaeon]